jgi:hypothetical protein
MYFTAYQWTRSLAQNSLTASVSSGQVHIATSAAHCVHQTEKGESCEDQDPDQNHGYQEVDLQTIAARRWMVEVFTDVPLLVDAQHGLGVPVL